MHKFIAFITAIVLSLASVTAQSNDYQRVVSALETDYTLSAVSFSRETVQLLSAFDFDYKDAVVPLLDGLEGLRLTTSRNVDGQFAQRAAEAFTAEGYDEVDVRQMARGRNVRLFVRRELTSITEAHIVSPVDKTVLFSVFGRFKMRDIRKLLERGQHGH